MTEAMAKAYTGSTASPWAKPGSPPSPKAWIAAARTKYLTTELAAQNYSNANDLDKRFQDVMLAVAMDWELFVADNYALLQAGYEGVHPWRTGRIVRANWSEVQGNRFAAITSAVGDVLLMQVTKHALLLGRTWPNFTHALWFGQSQEMFAERKLTRDDWQLYTCDQQRNPIFIQENSKNPDVHLVPQLEWITMPLDVATFVGDVLIGDSATKWADYEKRGAALWLEYRTEHRPVVNEILKKLGGEASENEVLWYTDRSPVRAHLADDLMDTARAAADMAIDEYNVIGGSLSAHTYGVIRSILLSVGIGTNSSSPVAPTCRHVSEWSESTIALV